MTTTRDGHKAAAEAAEALRGAFADLGLPERVWASLRPLVADDSGNPYVYLGLVRAEVAQRIAEAVRAGRTR
ncbi:MULTISPECIES: hypothetical protein [unclassified Streptomyces]|uniref:hypothetical protein n=1 Tax=unclassified Streptomyces TaxID=2593676 RepID=UPI00020E53E7|nr:MULTISPECIES: hypothetical protein [unclassified Streptomyces]EGJ73547.1 hypothetical protein STTU_0758 [Streptomyces sp. Tu6071]WEH30129.1 hypothetical protein P0D76_23965 [Streptomyces sp. AM 3-1-1]